MHLLMIYTGMMPGEAMSLKVENIDLENRIITRAGLKTIRGQIGAGLQDHASQLPVRVFGGRKRVSAQAADVGFIGLRIAGLLMIFSDTRRIEIV